MATITGVSPILRSLRDFFKYIFGFLQIEGELTPVPSPITQFADFVVDHPVVFIFVVAVPLVGLGIGLLRRMLST